VRNIVEECAEDLSSVNTVLNQELADTVPTRRVALAVEKSAGVEDKVHDASEKLAVVNEALKVEVKERHALEERLTLLSEQSEADRHALFHDTLTGLPNRALFNDRLEQGFAHASRHRWTMAVMFLDLNNFKRINDVHGHENGDTVLQIVAERLRKITRRDDTICRHGGDEFLYLLAEIREEADAVMIAKKLIGAIQAPCVIDMGDSQITVAIGASVGIAFFPKHGVDADSLLRHADAAMYEAKRSQCGYSVAPDRLAM
jgi:diguanylate cyclase (GGDEF)-like protein